MAVELPGPAGAQLAVDCGRQRGQASLHLTARPSPDAAARQVVEADPGPEDAALHRPFGMARTLAASRYVKPKTSTRRSASRSLGLRLATAAIASTRPSGGGPGSRWRSAAAAGRGPGRAQRVHPGVAGDRNTQDENLERPENVGRRW